MNTDRVFDITKVVEDKVQQQDHAIEFSKQNIVILDDAREPYYAALKNIDTSLYKNIEDINNTLVAVTSAYQDRINVGCRTDLFWVQTGFTTVPTGGGGYVNQYSYKCISINYVGYTSTYTLPSAVGIATTTGDPLPDTYGYESDNLYGLKVYNEPYMEDLLSTYVASGIGTIGAGSTALYLMEPIETEGLDRIKVGQIVQSSKPSVFPSNNVNTIVAIGTTSRDLSTIPSSGVTTNSSTINVLYLDDPALLPAKNPEDDKTYVTFTILVDPDTISDDFGLPFNSPPYTPQTVNMMGVNNIGAGSSIEYINNGDPNVSKQWNQFLNGFQDPADLRPGQIVTPPQVGAGVTYYRVGFSSRPAVYSGGFFGIGSNDFDHYAVEGETLISTVEFGNAYSPVRNEPISVTCTAQETALTNALTVKSNKESEFSSGISTFNSLVNLSNAIREDLSELNLRIWAYRMQIGKATENKIKYNTFTATIEDPKNKNIINGTGT